MNPAQPNLISVIYFLLIVFFVIISIIFGAFVVDQGKGRTRFSLTSQVAFGLIFWLILTALPSATGLIVRFPIPGIPLFFVIVILATFLFAFSSVGNWLSLGLPLWSLVLVQVFRLPLELVLHQWAEQGFIPKTMTWTGQNLDIITGISALILAPISVKTKTAAWIFNGIGFSLLLNVVRVAVMSSPLPFAWNVQPPLELALYFPYAWIGSVCVAGALAGHVILTRALLRKRISR